MKPIGTVQEEGLEEDREVPKHAFSRKSRIFRPPTILRWRPFFEKERVLTGSTLLDAVIVLSVASVLFWEWYPGWRRASRRHKRREKRKERLRRGIQTKEEQS